MCVSHPLSWSPWLQVLLEIGDHISSCLSRFTKQEAEEWRQ